MGFVGYSHFVKGYYNMALTLGKSFNKNYNMRVPFMDGFYNIGIFFNSKSPFLLFSIDPDFSMTKELKKNAKISMFKNIESSIFCEVFLSLHNYRGQNLDIVNQFKEVKNNYIDDVVMINNETIILSKHNINENVFYDQLIIYGFTLSSYNNEFLFLLTERQNIVSKLKKKIVRTSGIQIGTSAALDTVNEYRETSILKN